MIFKLCKAVLNIFNTGFQICNLLLISTELFKFRRKRKTTEIHIFIKGKINKASESHVLSGKVLYALYHGALICHY